MTSPATPAPNLEVICSLCNGSGRGVRTLAQRDSERTVLFRCDRCRSEFLDPQPSQEWLAEIYARYPAIRAGDLSRPKEPHFDQLLRSLDCDFSGSRVLEIGAAEGDCSRVIMRLWPTCRLTVIEPNSAKPDDPMLGGVHWVRGNLEDWLERGSDVKFDAIIALDVLEHLRDPGGRLAELCRTTLASDGRLIATVPNLDSTSRRLLGSRWFQYKVEHLHYFSRSGLARLAANSGLTTTQLGPLRKRLPLVYLLRILANTSPREGHGFWSAALSLVESLPRSVRQWSPRLPSGESCWIARKADGSADSRA